MKKQNVGATIFVALLFVAYLAFFNHTEQYEAGITLNMLTQKVGIQVNGGVHFTTPWTLVSSIDTRPQRVCITSASRAFNCKLAQFDTAHYEEFVATEGFRYYWWANRISFNFGYSDEYRGTKDILRGYAFSAQRYPFVKILKDY